jgi:hypothetical protein
MQKNNKSLKTVKRGYEYYDARGLLNTYATNTADAHAQKFRDGRSLTLFSA